MVTPPATASHNTHAGVQAGGGATVHSGRLDTVEAGRAIAALAVVAFHINAASGFVGLSTSVWTGPLQFGVDFFFVLSGFIITYVHRADLFQARTFTPYVAKRLIRLFPLLWLVVLGWAGLRSVLVEIPDPEAVLNSLILYPSLIEPIPGVVWTLRHEMLFYAAFAVALISLRTGVALFAVWGSAVLYQMAQIAIGDPFVGAWSMILSSFVLDFFMGASIALLAAHRPPRSWWPFALGAAAVIGYSWAWVHFGWSRADTLDYVSRGNLYVPLGGIAFALMLYGLICIESLVRVPRFLVLLGGASYAIYLVHVPVLSVTQRGLARLGDGPAQVSLFIVAVAIGLAVHLFFEKPVVRWLRDRVIRDSGLKRGELATPPNVVETVASQSWRRSNWVREDPE